MKNELENPFSVTKATEFSDVEINEYWVSFNAKDDKSFETILNPTEFLPKYLIGGKGSGKTHILRYFSFPLQKIRNEENIQTILSDDKYIGFYSVLHGLNSSRFEGKNVSQAEWESVFEYYFELYISDNLLRTVQEIFSLLQLDSEKEKEIIQNIIKAFGNYEEIKTASKISDLIEFLAGLRRKINSQVNNAAFTRKLEYDEVKILFSPGDLLFGIPKNISACIEQFKDVKFIYIFDEYEKLFEWQKKFVNTLVWDKKQPVTFWIGARRYGYTTRDTKVGEVMKSGSEFQEVNLDEIIRSNEELYKQFAEKLYVNRLIKYYESKGLKVNPDEIKRSFCDRFEPYNEAKILEEIIQKNKKKEFKHLKALRKKLSDGAKSGQALDLHDDSKIDKIVEAITLNTDNNPLEQKYKLFYLYQLWYSAKKGDTFKSFTDLINHEFSRFQNGEYSKFKDIVEKRKKDLIAQLTKENNVKNTEYSGIAEFIRISEGNARSFILILKKAVEFAKIRGEKPLDDGGRISLDSQYLAVYETARWFYEDIELVGETGKNMYSSLKRLTDYFILERFCDKPVETTLSCFYLKTDRLTKNSLDCIDIMKMHSVLIEDTEGRNPKNSGRTEKMFQINKVLAPLWNLPTVERGSKSLQSEVVEAIFNPDYSSKFDQHYKKRKSELNAPDFVKLENGNLSNTTELKF
ncbi:MAG TPA: hypothetical protein VFI29_15160 [Hanamia sp.]|nr:hypothetical protein [Hanamia sp.]